MKKILRLPGSPLFPRPLVFIALLAFMGVQLPTGCQKKDPAYPFYQEDFADIGLTAEEDSILAAQPSRIFSPSEILLDNSETVEQFLQRTNPARLSAWGINPGSVPAQHQGGSILSDDDIKRAYTEALLEEGNLLSDTIHHLFTAPAQPDTLIYANYASVPTTFERPAQRGYAYTYNGNTDLTRRKRAGDCKLLLYGLDCSGMATRMFNNAGLVFNDKYNAQHLATEGMLDSALLASPTLSNMNYQYVDTGRLPTSQLLSGDVIYFYHDNGEVFHMGIILVPTDKNSIYIYQSNGTNEVSMMKNNYRGCDLYSNDKKRGPRAVPIDQFINLADFRNYGILRLVPAKINPGLSGTWSYLNEHTVLLEGKTPIPFNPGEGVVNVDNLKLTFDEITNTFIGTASDSLNGVEAYSGRYYPINTPQGIVFKGVQMFNHDPISARIDLLTEHTLTLTFRIPNNGATQISSLTFVK